MTKRKIFIEVIAWIGLVVMIIYGLMYGSAHAIEQFITVPAKNANAF